MIKFLCTFFYLLILAPLVPDLLREEQELLELHKKHKDTKGQV